MNAVCKHWANRIAVGMLVWWGVTAVATVGAVLMIGEPAARADKPPKSVNLQEQLAVGRELFLRKWTFRDDDRPERSRPGPMFNDVSCVACHKQGTAGGAGPNDKNVDLLNLVTPRPQTDRRGRFAQTVERVHPGFASQRSVVLHRFGLVKRENGNASTEEYAKWRDLLLGTSARHPVSLERPYRRIRGFTVQLSQRNTPALFGAGIIDSIPDEAIIEMAERQRNGTHGIRGRVPQAPSGAVGRFGWRGQAATLHDFVLAACATELGLRVPGHSPAAHPVESAHLVAGEESPFLVTSSALDLTDEECRAMTAFVASLPAPAQGKHAHLEHALTVREGEDLFERIGCAVCHVRDLGPARGIYSDLLLHDMGPGLADLAAAIPEITVETGISSAGYYGSFPFEQNIELVTTNIDQEWRTPPLWGVRDSGPWLHDGRAATLEEAILLHGGEAEGASRRFRNLRPQDRQNVIDFLNSLTAPGQRPTRPQPAGGQVFTGSGFFSTQDER